MAAAERYAADNFAAAPAAAAAFAAAAFAAAQNQAAATVGPGSYPWPRHPFLFLFFQITFIEPQGASLIQCI